MSKCVRIGVVLTAAVVLLGAGSASVSSKKVSEKKYAKTVCTTITGLSGSEEKLVNDYNGLDTSSPEVFRAQAAGLVKTYLGDLKSASTKLKKVEPDVDGGRKISKIFVSYVDNAAHEVQGALEKFEAADPTSPAFQGDVVVFETSIKVLSAKIGDPFSKVRNQDLLGAFKKEKSCKSVVQVFGA
jgi:hypothetical protein